MNKYFINNIKYLIYLVVLIGFGSAKSGSYDDFFQAVKLDAPQEVKALLARGFDPNTVDANGQCGLYLALRAPSLRVAEVLVSWPQTNVNFLNVQDESPLMAAALGGHEALAEKLIKRDADVNKTGWTPLHYAATKGHLGVIRLLLENSAYIDAESPNGTTPLMMAAMYGSPDAVKLLLEEGADPLLKNQQGLTALQFAERARRPSSIELLAAAIRAKRPSPGKW